MLSFGDFKKNEITELIGNKDPLGLNSDINMSRNNSDTDIESYTTIKTNTETPSEKTISPSKTNMVFDAIPHYLKAGNFNSSADTKNTKEDENISPTLQVNPRSLRPASSGNLARNMSFKSFKSIQQSHKRSCTNSHCSCESLDNGNPGSSKDPNFTSNSNELMEQFNKKTNEIIKTMAGLHFSTIDLRNKLSKGCINNNCPIIAQVAAGNVSQGQGQGQVRVEIYPLA